MENDSIPDWIAFLVFYIELELFGIEFQTNSKLEMEKNFRIRQFVHLLIMRHDIHKIY